MSNTKWVGVDHVNSGEWKLVGKTLKATTICISGSRYNIGVEEEFAALVDFDSKTMEGSWKNVDPLTGSGEIFLRKIR